MGTLHEDNGARYDHTSHYSP